jgi:ABC-type branched-subunit amino acid transport system substrate-binding protein
MARWHTIAFGALALVVVAGALALGGHHVLAQEKEFVIVEATDLTGGFALSAGARTQGTRDYVRYLNEKRGGLKGVKVKHIVIDTAYSVDREVSGYKRARDAENALFFLTINSAAIATIAPLAIEDGMPFGGHNAEPVATFRPGTWFFPAIPLWLEGGGAAFDWWVKNGRAGKPGPPRIAIVNFDALPGKQASRFLRDVAASSGAVVAADLFTPIVTPDMAGIVRQLREAKPDIVIGYNTDANWTTLAKEMRRQGLDLPKISPFFGPLAQGVINAMSDAGVGMMSFLPYAMWDDTEVPGIQRIRALHREWYGPDKAEARHTYYWGWVAMCQVTEAIERAMAKVGYDGLSKNVKEGRKALKTTMENDMRGFTCEGITPPLKWTAQDHRPFDKVKVARVEAGPSGPVLKVIAGWTDTPAFRDEQRTVDWWIGKP